MWLMDGNKVTSTLWVGAISDPNWQIVGIRDFNGDGKTDILWRNSRTGTIAIWLMDGGTVISNLFVGSISDPNWQIVR